MRNLKKILALVLALVMSMSLMATANAFTDDASIDAGYETATKVLAGMKVFQGYPDGSFAPKANITRQEVAAIMYRISSADVTDKQAGLFVEGANFTDVKATDWSAGYIGYCANGGIVVGNGDGTFGPQANVTGYQVLAMALRAVGYDKNGEFTGADWAKNVATTAQALGILKNVPGTVQLSKPATRELVAELIFQTIATVPQVEYTPAFGYQPAKFYFGTTATLGEEQFDLAKRAASDKWGRPGTEYTYNVGNKATVIADKPIATYNTAVTECDVAKAAGLKANKTYTLYVNGIQSNLPVQILDTVDTLGAQGRITEVYKDTIVMIDTFLAKVTATADAKYDKNGHQIAPYSITMTVYDDTTGHTVTLTDADAAFGYTAGDFVLVNAYTETGDRDAAGLVATNRTNAGTYAVYAEIVGLAKSEVGAQSVIWYNAAKHTVNGNTYNDACEFNKNDANTTTVNYTWYFDQFGNLIGAFEIATKYDYAVLTKMWWAGDAATGLGKAMGTLKYMDGSENTVEIAKIGGKTTTYAVADNYGIVGENFQLATYVSTNASVDNAKGDWIDGHLLRVYTNAKGAVELVKVADEKANHTEITAKVTNKYAYIGALKVDTATLFLVGTPTNTAATSYSYTTYTGINEIPSFTAKSVVVDYVLNSNGVVKYAYIIGTPDSATTKDHVLITNTGYTATLKTAGDVSYYEVNLYTMEGLVTVKTKDAAIKDELTKAENVNCLFYVTYTDGYATGLRKVGAPYQYDTTKNLWDAQVTEATYLNGVLEAVAGSTNRWNLTESTVVVGTLAADMTDKIVYILSDGKNMVSKIYIIDVPADSINPPVEADPTTGIVYYTVTMYMPDGSTKTATAKWTGTGSFAAGSQSFATIAPVHFPELIVSNWTVLVEQTAALTVEAGGVYEMTYVINANNN